MDCSSFSSSSVSVRGRCATDEGRDMLPSRRLSKKEKLRIDSSRIQVYDTTMNFFVSH